ncbi:hypothetical protein BRCON_0746 [Candidatus Sumerlaea chitinivorans]|uniref:Uncharacterized protein n=1 Tax=Sumerlaea chitinivorans TaxID=2250252 RepID=A0A2Z4Y4S5_SUMC1|nr:hypothetical protein BRCON_0746 [Candidatus Sumerlaea chitinivorans]
MTILRIPWLSCHSVFYGLAHHAFSFEENPWLLVYLERHAVCKA